MLKELEDSSGLKQQLDFNWYYKRMDDMQLDKINLNDLKNILGGRTV